MGLGRTRPAAEQREERKEAKAGKTGQHREQNRPTQRGEEESEFSFLPFFSILFSKPIPNVSQIEF